MRVMKTMAHFAVGRVLHGNESLQFSRVNMIGIRSWMSVLAFSAATLVAADLASAQTTQRERDAFQWAGHVPSGQWVTVRNLNGDITVEPTSGNRVEVTATKSWRRGDPSQVRIEVSKHGAGNESVLVCAIWTENTICDENRYSTRSSGARRESNDTKVDFVVKVPRGVKVHINSVNGGLSVDGATSEVRAGTVNGNVEAYSTGGPVAASTVNGNLRVRMGEIAGREDLSYSTVNGNIVVEFGGDLDADLEMSTVNGSFTTNFPLQITGRLNPRQLRTTVGDGGRRVKLTTVNGNVELRRR
jgi:hypothetical protein